MGKLLLIGSILIAMVLISCDDNPFPSKPPLSQIIAYVHWQDQGLSGKKIVLVGDRDTIYTDANGFAKFLVPAGRYTLRAYYINRGGPCCGSIDFNVETVPAEVKMIDIVDCLPCV
jgi:hypothetical protein